MSVLDITSGVRFPTLSAAIAASRPNDVIQITGGRYVENFPDITHNLTIEAVGGLAYLSTPQPEPANGRAILYVPLDKNASLTVSGLVLSGAVDADDNGSGILFENGNAALTINKSWIHGNQDGILAGYADAASKHGMTVTVENSEIDDNGAVPANPDYGYDHNLYIGRVTRLVVTNSYIHSARGGHEIKTRALTSIITNNRIFDGPTAATSYSIDLPDGGTNVIAGNIIEKGPTSPNLHVIHFGGEAGVTYPGSSLTVEHNTIINDRDGATVLLNQSQNAGGHTIPAIITGNTLYNFDTRFLYQDSSAPPTDNATDNMFIDGPAPRLDTSHPFTVPPVPVPAPTAATIFPLALLATAMLRYRRNRRAAARLRRAPGSGMAAAGPVRPTPTTPAHPASG